MIACVGVIVPAHNEQGLLPACLASLRRAAHALCTPVHLVVVADACRDRTVQVAQRSGAAVVTIAAQDSSGSFEAGVSDLDRVADWVAEHVPLDGSC